MQKTLNRVAICAILVAGLAGCQGMSTDQRNAAVGAGAGAIIAKATDSNILAGAAIGGAAGALCDDMGVCRSY